MPRTPSTHPAATKSSVSEAFSAHGRQKPLPAGAVPCAHAPQNVPMLSPTQPAQSVVLPPHSEGNAGSPRAKQSRNVSCCSLLSMVSPSRRAAVWKYDFSCARRAGSPRHASLRTQGHPAGTRQAIGQKELAPARSQARSAYHQLSSQVGRTPHRRGTRCRSALRSPRGARSSLFCRRSCRVRCWAGCCAHLHLSGCRHRWVRTWRAPSPQPRRSSSCASHLCSPYGRPPRRTSSHLSPWDSKSRLRIRCTRRSRGGGRSAWGTAPRHIKLRGWGGNTGMWRDRGVSLCGCTRQGAAQQRTGQGDCVFVMAARAAALWTLTAAGGGRVPCTRRAA